MTCTYTPSTFCGLSSRLGFGAFILAAALGGAPGIVWAADDPPTAISDQPDMTWFTDARLGIFIHWGIYSEGKGSESWAFHEGDMPYDTYLAQAKTFTAAKYHPERWAELFKEAGARYAVLTSKHHDGFALWDTAQSKLNAKDSAPAGRDLIGPFCAALRKEGLKVGLYFSHLDWSHPDYASVLKEGGVTEADRKNRFSYPQGPENPAAWERFLAFHRAQLREISERFHPDLFWFDGDWERSAAQWRMPELRKQLKEWLPGVILNSRMAGYGDYATPEQALPVRPPAGPWELCMTINVSSPNVPRKAATCCSMSVRATTAPSRRSRRRSSAASGAGPTSTPRRSTAPPPVFRRTTTTAPAC